MYYCVVHVENKNNGFHNRS